MRKTFTLTHPKKKRERLAEAAVADIRKYIKRERKKELPEGVDFWDFDCKFGPTADDAAVVHVAELSKCIAAAEKQELESFYVEILAKPATRTKKPEA
jgi:hypothetical protein